MEPRNVCTWFPQSWEGGLACWAKQTMKIHDKRDHASLSYSTEPQIRAPLNTLQGRTEQKLNQLRQKTFTSLECWTSPTEGLDLRSIPLIGSTLHRQAELPINWCSALFLNKLRKTSNIKNTNKKHEKSQRKWRLLKSKRKLQKSYR